MHTRDTICFAVATIVIALLGCCFAGELPKLYDATLGRQLMSAGVDAERIIVGYHVRYGNTAKISETIDWSLREKGRVALDWEADDAFERINPLLSQGEKLTTAINHAKWILSESKRQHGSLEFGMYGIYPPTYRVYNAIAEDPKAYRKALAPLRQGRDSLVDRLPCVYPSLYLPRVWRERYPTFRAKAEKVAFTVVGEAKRSQKHCIAFVTPAGFTSPDHFREWVEVVGSRADGVAVWSTPESIDPEFLQALQDKE